MSKKPSYIEIKRNTKLPHRGEVKYLESEDAFLKFALWNRSFAFKVLPQYYLEISHNNTGDRCLLSPRDVLKLIKRLERYAAFMEKHNCISGV